jgi:TolB-like protein/Flp pilus assembly protein TadD
MASLIPGYEYDIFISYRQKDNRGERWVSEFVESLKTELESTFKEEISVYFDINPHDGLLETHDVDASLKEKLKCLVFIPILSRTYCDPKSFAWEHEFKAFVEEASQDEFGLKIKLPNGNVASRVLPVRIYDLDPADIKLCESVLGGVLRGVKFIYAEPGVNRPLKLNDDDKTNLNKTRYINQINKVANAVKEIIAGLKNPDKLGIESSNRIVEVKPSVRIKLRTKIIAGVIITMALVVAGYFIIPDLFKPSVEPEKSIAVLPFKLLSDEPDKQYLADGMMDAILLHLSKIKDLRVMSRTSVELYRNLVKTIPEIGKELGVEYILEGSFQKSGDKVRLIVKLFRAIKDEQVWSNEYDRKWNDVFSVQSEVAQSIAEELQATITPEEKLIINKIPTSNLTAYDFYQRGQEAYLKNFFSVVDNRLLKQAERFYLKALDYDSTYAQAYAGLARVYRDENTQNQNTYYSTNYLDSVRILAGKALSFNPHLAEGYDIMAYYYIDTGQSDKALEELNKAIKNNPNDWEAYQNKAYLYAFDYRLLDFVEVFENLSKAININKGFALPTLQRYLGQAFIELAGIKERGIYYNQQAFDLDGDSLSYYYVLGKVEETFENFNKAIEYYLKCFSINPDDSRTLATLGYNYEITGHQKESLEYYKRYIKRLKATGDIGLGFIHRIGYAFWINGYKKEAEQYFDEQIKQSTESIKMNRSYVVNFSAYYDLAGVYALRNEKEKALSNLNVFTTLKVCPKYWIIIFKYDPMFASIRNDPEFKMIFNDVESKYNKESERLSKWLKEQGML